jgi:hypothetical protein|tara:strand:- start:166 stop:357 length:192 start_codon:yes stop_codon:yes gene_type:complete
MNKLTIKANIPEEQFMEGCLNQAHQLNHDMTLVITFYALAHSWYYEKLVFLMDEVNANKHKKR